ncbi:site-specific DNA-methyltransferase [uncultured Flavobacterium sp.]|uniref:site-specific DNA-methyltransferase n=1 Tax=uncultured Flavobacterium sp. TaxID=165435 RepID=UPI0030EB4E91|tara:strand:- start:64543 stop:66276 length:1734 start_codon:yes stop_codon:yes gene_type:complete
MNKKALQKLELTWIGKGEEPKLEPRILIENPDYSYGDTNAENILIHGDNLLALKALEQDFEGIIKCIYIDPPYNTGGAFEHYDDNLEHSIWLNLMYQRIGILHKLLSKDGVFCIHLDDQEVFYAKIICDELFGRDKFVTSIAVKSSTPSGLKTAHRNKTIIKQKDLILVYKKSESLVVNPQYAKRDKWDSHYSKYFDLETKTIHDLIDVLLEKNIISEKVSIKKLDFENKKFKSFYIKHCKNIFQTQPTMPDEYKELSKRNPNKIIEYVDNDGKVNYAQNGRRFVFLDNSLNVLDNGETDLGTLLCDFWSDIDFQNTQNEGHNSFPAGKKPEKLLNRILKLFTNEGDYVLDSFLGSGSTAAAALKLKRKFIGIELGEHAISHCYPRLKNIVDGIDNSGISEDTNWQGGSGFKFYTLAPSLLKQDKFGNWVISEEYNPDMLAAAMAKQEGFNYLPHEDKFWKQGNSSENDFIFTTTQFLTVETIDSIQDDMKDGESVLICCKAFQKECKNKYSNITLKKIPQMLLDRCEFGKDDYSFNIVNLPIEQEEMETEEEIEASTESVQELRDKNEADNQVKLF